MNKTRVERRAVQVGDVYRERDPRMKGRRVTVLSLGDGSVVCTVENSTRRTIISVRGLQTRFDLVVASGP
jgi:hypothetical protein